MSDQTQTTDGTPLATAVAALTPWLETPFAVRRGQPLRNRLVRTALSEGLAAQDGRPTPQLLELYRRWSTDGGVGMIITGNVMVDRRHLGEPGNVVVEDERDLDVLKTWADAARAGGNQVWMQINHAGRQAQATLSGVRPVAPSAIKAPIPGAATPRALPESEILEIIGRFAETARIAKAAGFDGVELHGAHGYLISQFLSPLANTRDDDWGGDATRRMRFVLEVVRTTRAAVGEDFPLGIKLNSADFQRGGFDEEESMAVVDALAREGIDLVEVSGGTYGSPAMIGHAERQSTRKREAYFQTYAEEVRRRTPDVALLLTGGFRTRAAMDAALEDGACDLVGFARATCINPTAGDALLRGHITEAPVISREIGLRPLLGRITELHKLDAVIDMLWHGFQMHRIGEGKDPAPDTGWLVPVVWTLRRHGRVALQRRR